MPEKWGFLHGDKTLGSRCFKRPPLDYRYFARFKAGPVGRSRLRRRRPAAGTSASAARSSQSHPLRLSDSLLAAPIRVATCRSLRRDRPLKIQRKNSGSGNKCLRAIGTTTRSLRNWVRSAKGTAKIAKPTVETSG